MYQKKHAKRCRKLEKLRNIDLCKLIQKEKRKTLVKGEKKGEIEENDIIDTERKVPQFFLTAKQQTSNTAFTHSLQSHFFGRIKTLSLSLSNLNNAKSFSFSFFLLTGFFPLPFPPFTL